MRQGSAPPRFQRLPDWLRWQETLHPRTIELGLDRVRGVAERLDLLPVSVPVITVAGTNGKGSCVAYLDAIYRTDGYRTGAYTSPHLLRYNERIRINGTDAGDDALCSAFAEVDRARGQISLTYFEFGTLAALLMFRDAGLDVMLLEVGLGGRLDAVNIVDADVALVTSIGLDHTDWLGIDREAIGREKAGIFRRDRPAICGDRQPPASIKEFAAETGARLHRLGADFDWNRSGKCWTWVGWDREFPAINEPALPGDAQLDNAACAVACAVLLESSLPLRGDAIQQAPGSIRLPARVEVVDGAVPVILDVAHNAEACVVLARYLQAHPVKGRTLAVMGMLSDKPAEAVAAIMNDAIDEWHLGGLGDLPRAQEAGTLAARLAGVTAVRRTYPTVGQAWQGARQNAQPEDRIVVFGSFHTVEQLWEQVHG